MLVVQDNLMDSLNAKEQQAKAASWMDSILSLIPGRKQASSDEPSDEAIKRTHDYLRCAPSLAHWEQCHATQTTSVLASHRYVAICSAIELCESLDGTCMYCLLIPMHCSKTSSNASLQGDGVRMQAVG